MKTKILFGLGIALSIFFAACKKENLLNEQYVEKQDPWEFLKDSISYSINGITYGAARYSSNDQWETLEPYSKIDSIVNNSYYIGGIKDSVLHTTCYNIYNDTLTVTVRFIKTYHKTRLLNGDFLRPEKFAKLFALGSRNYAIDFERDNTQNGVAISINDGFKTYGSRSFMSPPQLSPDAQKDSKFEIISIKKSSSGFCILEAKFNATVFNWKNESKKLENGYLRLNLGILERE